MGSTLLPDAAFRLLPRYPFVCSGAHSCVGQHPPLCRVTLSGSNRNRSCSFADKRLCKSIPIVFSSMDDSNDTVTDMVDDQGGYSGRNEFMETEDELITAKQALSEAQARYDTIKKERDQLLEELACSEAKQQEYVTAILHDKEVAIAELEAAKSLFQQKLQESVQEKFTLESKLVLAKQDAVDLAVQVEKLAEVAFQQATSHILEDAKLRISVAETTAAETAHQIEKQIKDATWGTIAPILERSKYAIEEALNAAEEARRHAEKNMETFVDNIFPVSEVVSVKAENVNLQGIICNIESQLVVSRNEVDQLKLELEHNRLQLKAFEKRASDAEKALLDLQQSGRKHTLKQEEEIKLLLENMKTEMAEKKKAVSKAFKSDLGNISATVEAAKETVHSKDYAYLRRCEALQRSLKASEYALNMWRQRAEMAESLLLKERLEGEESNDAVYVANGGRIDLLTNDDSQKWKLLSDGPRREIPQWMARRIKTISPKFPPKKIDAAEALTAKFRSLQLPKPDEVWSIAQEKPKKGDTLIEHVFERETIEKKRKALERVLQRKAIQWQRTPEPTKLEPGTGTGREIVFQAFNWESWRRQWYLELAAKAADLSQCGVTAVWLPPPTESVAPQGYMPSDLYNLNSAYGSELELKYCIQEMHSQDLLALGDVVLNHRCAHKQSPNGVWNIFGGKLAWGPEAIVCDDPNFQGRGNPSSGDIFHAAPNIDHSQDFVRRDIKQWLNWLRNDIGFDGWRLDFVRGFSGTFVKEYIEASNPVFAIGEYWDSLAYEHGDLCYNQDAHRQRIINWINATGGTSSAFDITTKGILHSALHNQYWRLIDPQGKPTGVMGWWPSRAVTFLENHDTGSTQGHWPFPRDKLVEGYAYILTHPGTPAIFYDHLYEFGIHDNITELIAARRQAGIHCRSSIKIFHANQEGYVAQVGDELVIKLGYFDWHPFKENHLEGSWQKFVDRGSDYQVWLRQ